MGVDESGWEWMGVGGSGWMRVDGSAVHPAAMHGDDDECNGSIPTTLADLIKLARPVPSEQGQLLCVATRNCQSNLPAVDIVQNGSL
eukprot:NODE_2579_length_672_cov_16.030498_g2117_i0.p1 GENE.NODE_2579_length_672_cov_16.030498_g2117_i0~~NODE_2579_length_672_cov_16.030498_g2117_i0.p1  ORF type:complete len:87 (+),score=14.41 NODE_2579_length_672_cov_16.030498_g2117_i0:13-273(+)